MIKIIKKGVLPKKIFQQECNYCGCCFKYDVKEIVVQYDGLRYKDAIKCPFCLEYLQHFSNLITTENEK